MSIASAFKAFLGHHSKELHLLGDALKVIASAVGIDPADMVVVENAVGALHAAGNNIADGLSTIKNDATKLSKADIEAAVESYAKDHLASIVAAAVEAATKPAETPVV